MKPAARIAILSVMTLGLLAGCKWGDLFNSTDNLDVDDDGLRRFPWGTDLDDDDDGALQFIVGGTDYDDTDKDVRANDGNGTFDAAVFYDTGFGPSGLYLADFDRDDHLDVVTSNQDAVSATIWFGAGDGTLATPVTIAVPDNLGVSTVVVGDFNEDKALDFVAGASNLLFRNAGSRTFAAPVQLDFDGARNVVCDLDGDGHLDIVGVKLFDGVTAILGDGDGTFSNPVDSGSGVNSRAIAIADFNGDQALDAAVVTDEGTSDGTVAVLLGNGDGSFRAPLTKVLPDAGMDIAAADLDNDGKVDVVVTDPVLGRVYVLPGDGTGRFGTTRTINVDGAGRVLIADLDGDGVRDLVVASQPAGLLRALGDGDGTFGTFTSLGLNGAFDVSAGNLDSDRRLDLVAIQRVGSLVAVLTGN